MHLEMQGIRRSSGPLRLTPHDKQSLRHSRAGRSAGDKAFATKSSSVLDFEKLRQISFCFADHFCEPFEVGPGELRRLECASMVSSKSAQTETTSR
jgi:hypothetical protein